APMLGEHSETIAIECGRSGVHAKAATPVAVPLEGAFRRPLEGLRVLDLGVIVMGAELARLFADQGAEVIKIESRAFPDGAHVSPVHFAIGHRNAKGFGLNLRSSHGIEVFKQLVTEADVVLANYKPGTMEKLGIGYEVLSELNPGIVLVESDAVGAS